MATQIQYRRGTSAQNDAFTGALGEITVDTTNKTIRVHDGVIAGGNTIVNTYATQTLSFKTLSAPIITGTLSSTGYINTTGNISTAQLNAGQINTTGNILGSGATLVAANVNGSLSASGITTLTNSTNAVGGATGALQVTGGAYIAQDLWVVGNIYAGNLMSTVANIVTIQDGLIYLDRANTYPYNYSIGMYSHYIGGPANAYVHTALTRQPNDNTWWFISNIAEPSPATGNINVYDSNRILDNIVAGNVNLTGNVVSAGGVHNALTVNGNLTVASAYAVPSANAGSSLGTSATRWNYIYGVNGNFLSVNANYADLAEVYTSDQQYPSGTVVVFGGEAEVMQSHSSHDPRIAGVVSTNPAYLMNSEAKGVPVALQGRVPCRVLGPVSKGDRVVSSHIAGVAQALDPQQYQPGCIIGKALQSIDSTDISIIEVVVGRL